METVSREREWVLPGVADPVTAIGQPIKRLWGALGGYLEGKLDEMVCAAYDFSDDD